MTTKQSTFQCPDCDHAPYADPRGLSSHRRSAHGILGTSKATVYEREKKGKRGDMYGKKHQCPHCDFIAAWKGGLTHHINAKHKPTAIPAKPKGTQLVKTNGSTKEGRATNHATPIEAHTASSDPFDIPVAIAFGRFREICTSMAIEHDLPPRLFAARFAELVYRSTVR